MLVAVDLIFLIPGQAQWKWTLGTSWSSSFTNSQPSLLHIRDAMHRVQDRLVYGRGQELVSSKPQVGCQEHLLVTVPVTVKVLKDIQ